MLEKYLDEIYDAMRTSGVFFTAGVPVDGVNTTTITWGTFGRLWNRPIAIIPIRSRRYTYELVDKYGEFTISVPRKDLFKELSAAGSFTGRNRDKFTDLHLHPAKARKVNTYVISDCGLHIECRVIYRYPIVAENLDPVIEHEIYAVNAHHEMFYGEILDIYEK